MQLTVVVCTHNQHDLLRTCLRSVEVALGGIDGECIVVDNASGDATPDLMRTEFPEVRYIRNSSNVHYTRAVNQGMRASHAEFFFLLNDDTELAPDLLRSLLGFMRANPRCGAVGPQFLTPGTREVQLSAQRLPTPLLEVVELAGLDDRLGRLVGPRPFRMAYPEPLGTRRVGWVCGGALLVRAGVMRELGYHDESYLFYCDETDLGRRLNERGYQVWYYADTWLLHHHGMSTVKTDRRVRFELIGVRSRRHYYRKFFGPLGMLAVELADAGVCVVRTLRALLAGRRDLAARSVHRLRCLVEASFMPVEERQAIEGYRRAEWNGKP